MNPEKRNSTINVLSWVVLAGGAIAAQAFLYNAGGRGAPVFLFSLFVVWTLSPYLALGMAALIPVFRKANLDRFLSMLMIFIPVGSIVGYTGILTPAWARPAFIYLVIPLLAWVFLVVYFARAIFRIRQDRATSANPNS